MENSGLENLTLKEAFMRQAIEQAIFISGLAWAAFLTIQRPRN